MVIKGGVRWGRNNKGKFENKKVKNTGGKEEGTRNDED